MNPVLSALARYRVMAWIVGVMLLVLVLVAMPLKYVWHDETLVAIVGPLHGFLYFIYLLVSLDLAIRAKFSPLRALVVLLAGTIPFVSFIVEHSVTKQVRAEHGEVGANLG